MTKLEAFSILQAKEDRSDYELPSWMEEEYWPVVVCAGASLSGELEDAETEEDLMRCFFVFNWLYQHGRVGEEEWWSACAELEEEVMLASEPHLWN